MPPLTRNKGKRTSRRPPSPPQATTPPPRKTSSPHALPSPPAAVPSPPPEKPEQPKPQSTTQPPKQPKKQPQQQQQQQQQKPPRQPRQWPIPRVKVWRDEGEEMSPLYKKRYANSKKLFSLKIYMDGEMIIDEKGKVKYDGGLIRYVDWFRSDDTDMSVLGDVCSRLGLDGLSMLLGSTLTLEGG